MPFLIPHFAHEVYVLTPSQVKLDKQHNNVNIFQALSNSHNRLIFMIFLLLMAAIVYGLIRLKASRSIKKLGSMIDKAGYFAPDLIRVVFGASLILSAQHKALFGPELPLNSFPAGEVIRPMLYIFGASLILGIFTRLVSLIFIIFWLLASVNKGWYLLTYSNYVGEALALVLIKYQNFSLDKLLAKRFRNQFRFTKPELALPFTRVLFGFSLLYAALNIKVLHPAVSLDVAQRYHLAPFFHMDPLMLVFMAALVEILIALFYMFGLLQRVTTIFFLMFITMSLIYFKESVWPHYMLFALAIGIFLDKPDKYTLDRKLTKK